MNRCCGVHLGLGEALELGCWLGFVNDWLDVDPALDDSLAAFTHDAYRLDEFRRDVAQFASTVNRAYNQRLDELGVTR